MDMEMGPEKRRKISVQQLTSMKKGSAKHVADSRAPRPSQGERGGGNLDTQTTIPRSGSGGWPKIATGTR